MPLDDATRRFAFLLQRDLRRFEEREEGRTARGEAVRYDPVSRHATWETRRGDVIGRWYAEPLARYEARDGILRWAWAGRATNESPTHAELVFREGHARGVPQLSMSVVGDLEEHDAWTLARLGAVVARADGVYVHRAGGDEVVFVGLYDRTGGVASAGRISVPPPPVMPRASTPPPQPAYRSLPPIREVYEPRGVSRAERDEPVVVPPVAGRVREPSRALFLPLANAALAAIAQRFPGFSQGLFVLTVDADDALREPQRRAVPKRHLVVQLVALDAAGVLRALDPPASLVEAAAVMIEADRADRADRDACWRKLSARITPKPDGGATLHVDVI